MINGIYGTDQFLQFRNPGSFTVVITAVAQERVEQAGETVKVSIQHPDVAKFPIIWAAQDRYQPRTIAFSVANAPRASSRISASTPGLSATERPVPAPTVGSVMTIRARFDARSSLYKFRCTGRCAI